MMEFVSWDDDIPNIWENKKCSKPPTSTNQILFEFYVHIILQRGGSTTNQLLSGEFQQMA